MARWAFDSSQGTKDVNQMDCKAHFGTVPALLAFLDKPEDFDWMDLSFHFSVDNLEVLC